MTGREAPDPDATPPHGVVSDPRPTWLLRTGAAWFIVTGVVIALVLFTLVMLLV